MNVYRVYENYHNSDNELGTFEYGLYSSRQLAEACIEKIWTNLGYPKSKNILEQTKNGWYAFDKKTNIVYCIIINEIPVLTSVELTVHRTIQMIIPSATQYPIH